MLKILQSTSYQWRLGSLDDLAKLNKVAVQKPGGSEVYVLQTHEEYIGVHSMDDLFNAINIPNTLLGNWRDVEVAWNDLPLLQAKEGKELSNE